MNKWKKGQRLRHLDKPDWGVGQVLQDQDGAGIRVFFAGVGEKLMDAAYGARLAADTSNDADNLLLDNLHLPSGTVASRPMLTFAQAKERFLELFPGGFYGPRLVEEERNYKDRLNGLCVSLLGQTELQRLIADGAYGTVVDSAVQFIGDGELNLPHHIEKMAFTGGVRKLDARTFSESLQHWMHSDEPTASRLAPIARELASIGADKWPILTAFTFFSSPERSVYIKPENLKYAAEVCRFEINYRPGLNALTLDSVSGFYRYLEQKLADLKPRDMMDVQSFIWCIDPKNYGA